MLPEKILQLEFYIDKKLYSIYGYDPINNIFKDIIYEDIINIYNINKKIYIAELDIILLSYGEPLIYIPKKYKDKINYNYIKIKLIKYY